MAHKWTTLPDRRVVDGWTTQVKVMNCSRPALNGTRWIDTETRRKAEIIATALDGATGDVEVFDGMQYHWHNEYYPGGYALHY